MALCDGSLYEYMEELPGGPGAFIVLDDAGDFSCTITDTGTGDVYELTVSTGGLEPGVGVRELSFQIGDTPL